MKIFLSLSLGLIFTSATAFATPNVGDTVTFSVSAVAPGYPSETGTLTKTILDFYSGVPSYVIETTTVINGTTQNSGAEVPANQILSDARIQQILSNCGSFGGTLEALTTPAGTFNTCAVPILAQSESETEWIAAVPFGIAKSVQNLDDGATVIEILQSFTAGQ